MKKRILSIAIALPVLMASAAASASETVKISPVTPAIGVGSRINTTQKLGDNINKPGGEVRGPKPGKGPPPPRREILQNRRVIIQPSLNSIPQNLNINNVAPGR